MSGLRSLTPTQRDDELAIRRLIESWVIWRDAGDRELFATLWHPQGRMLTTWYQAGATDFIARSRRALEQGLKVLHMLDGTTADLAGSRAVAQTKMQIIQRGIVHGELVNVVCHGRFTDLLEVFEDRWMLYLRQPIYELDHMSPVDPSVCIALEPDLLASFPESYRHLGHLHTQLGFEVDRILPGTRGPEIDQIQEHARRWLAGDTIGTTQALARSTAAHNKDST